jgi:hypothetical protein
MPNTTDRPLHVRGLVAASAFATGLVLIAWLPLGVLNIVPFVLSVPGFAQLRVHAGAAIACLLIAAWGFWKR